MFSLSDNTVSSSEITCDRGDECDNWSCQDFAHAPSIDSILVQHDRNFRPNENCDICFIFYLIGIVRLITTNCCNYSRASVSCSRFPENCKTAYNNSLNNYKKCSLIHGTAPNKFCIVCFSEYLKDSIHLVRDFGVYQYTISMKITLFKEQMNKQWESCYNGCTEL